MVTARVTSTPTVSAPCIAEHPEKNKENCESDDRNSFQSAITQTPLHTSATQRSKVPEFPTLISLTMHLPEIILQDSAKLRLHASPPSRNPPPQLKRGGGCAPIYAASPTVASIDFEGRSPWAYQSATRHHFAIRAAREEMSSPSRQQISSPQRKYQKGSPHSGIGSQALEATSQIKRIEIAKRSPGLRTPVRVKHGCSARLVAGAEAKLDSPRPSRSREPWN
ncbi:hypothetical protein JTE90_024222 [Oedothorax gibbosus]|uniref:Uncharacterized protein n=1 Tax=Oedothorax gibbosus TaxID=931172 RepID=A0AAV6U7J3_9ARAC|nr:hypothetical protein JTE90_024222 [Oedothorax gibbosus]